MYENVLSRIGDVLNETRTPDDNRSLLVAIDGRCGSGKTYLAEIIRRQYACNVFHMDDFYLPPAQRAADWERQIGGNMDFERLIREVLKPTGRGAGGSYGIYDCGSGSCRRKSFGPAALTVLEGSYSMTALRILEDRGTMKTRRMSAAEDKRQEVKEPGPTAQPSASPDPSGSSAEAKRQEPGRGKSLCVMKIFLTCSPEVQKERLAAREGDRFAAFEKRWIPMEERYCAACRPMEQADMVIDTTDESRPVSLMETEDESETGGY